MVTGCLPGDDQAAGEADAPGRLYAWGCDRQFRLGLGQEQAQVFPALVGEVSGHEMEMDGCGETHSGAIDARRRLWT